MARSCGDGRFAEASRHVVGSALTIEGSAQAAAKASMRRRMSRPNSQRPIGSAIGRINLGRHEKEYRQVARVRSGPSGLNDHPPDIWAKNHGPLIIRMPTWVGGLYDTYSETIRSRCRDVVDVRTPLATFVALAEQVLFPDERIPKLREL